MTSTVRPLFALVAFLGSAGTAAAGEECRVFRVTVHGDYPRHEENWSAYGEKNPIESTMRSEAARKWPTGFDLMEISSGHTYEERNGMRVCSPNPGGYSIARDFGHIR